MSQDTLYTDVPITLSHQGTIAVLSLNNPPVNALSSATRFALSEAITSLNTDVAVQAIILTGSGRHFCAGADIREFGQDNASPLTALCNQIENCSKLVVAAIQGGCLGGGLELALSAHYRLADSEAHFGFPEINLGLIPGGGGTQRAPRLMGAGAALALMLSGKALSAESALQQRLVDKLSVGEPLLSEAIRWTQTLLASDHPLRRTRDASALSDRESALVPILAARNKIRQHSGSLTAENIINAVETAVLSSFIQGLESERLLFEECLNSSQCAGLTHAFLAEKRAARIEESSSPRPLRQIGVVGAGTMGSGIVLALLAAEYDVVLVDSDASALQRGINIIFSSYEKIVAKQRLSTKEKERQLARLTTSIDYHALRNTDMVIEAIFEDLATKQTLFRMLDRICRQDTLFASNTSYLDIDVLSTAVSHPQRFIGIHFFSPVTRMKLVEVIVPETAVADTIATASSLAKQLKKIPIRARNYDGFIGNRMLAVYREAAELVMLDGASPFQIDKAMRTFGFPMGPFQVMDLVGGDIAWATRKRRASIRDPRLRTVSIADELCEKGWFGQKTGRGYYLYSATTRQGIPNPEVEKIVATARKNAGIRPQTFSDQEIIDRYLAAMINEGANILHQGIAQRPSDIDVVLLNGYGFPREKGGPMFYADQVGLEQILQNIILYSAMDPLFWQPSSLLLLLVSEGKNFASLNS